MRNKVVLLLTVVLSVACVHEREGQQSSYISLEVTASTNKTKTDITGSSIRYSADEAIFVQCEGYNNLVMSNAGSLDVEKFSGKYKATGLSGTGCPWYSVYPSTLTITEEGAVSGTLPSTQTAPFDPTANIMYSDIVVADYDEENPPELSFEMNQLMGLQTVQLRTSSVLAGDFQTDIHAPSVAFTGNERKYVTSTYDTPVALGTDQKHWVCLFVNPAKITGAKLIIRTDKHTFTYQSTKKFTPVAGALTMLPLMDVSDFSIEGPTTLKKRVACWGDSYTHGSYTYTTHLRALLGDDWEVYDGGISGNRTYEIAARQGGLPIVTGSAFTIPAGTETVPIDGVLRTHNVLFDAGYYNIRLFGGSLCNPCKLVGTNGEEILCNVSSSFKTVDDVTTYYGTIKRLTAGDPVEIAEHTPIETYAARELKNVDLTIIYMGANGMFGSETNQGASLSGALDNLVAQYQEMIDATIHSDSFLALGFHNRREFENYGYSEKFENAFGQERFLNLRKPVVKDEASCKYWLLRSGAFEKEEDIPQSELNLAAKGDWPRCLFHDISHPNDYGSKIFALLIYDRMVELGYVD